MVRAGTANDPPGQAGLAALTAQLWDQGTEQMTAKAFAEAIDSLGTSLRVSTGADMAQLSFSAENRALAQLLDLTGRMLSAPRFDEADFDREKSLQLSSLTSGPDDPAWIADRVFLQGTLHGHDVDPVVFDQQYCLISIQHDWLYLVFITAMHGPALRQCVRPAVAWAM